MGYQIGSRALPLDIPWEYNDVQYPANWLRLSSSQDRAMLGISWSADGAAAQGWDQRFFWDVGSPKQLDDKTETVDGVEVKTTGLKTQWKAQQDQIASTLLAPSDWRVVKELEVNSSFAAAKTAFPTAWQTYRAAVRTSCNTRQTEIDACKTAEELKDLLFGSSMIVKTKEQQKTDADGKGVVDSDDKPVMETVNDLDSDGNVQMIVNPAIATAWPADPA
tara:strand:+ start:46 stop:705 length:660 start_codon:yes stop_codon:yes gene_type:complete